MQPRIDTTHVSPDAYKAMLGLQSYIDATSLEKSLRELVNIRVSQINSCAFCLHIHLRDARKAGEAQERLELISAGTRQVFTVRERAALAWVEAVRLSSRHSRAGRCPRGGANGILGARASRSLHGGGGDQLLEPADGRVSYLADRRAGWLSCDRSRRTGRLGRYCSTARRRSATGREADFQRHYQTPGSNRQRTCWAYSA